MEDGNDQTEEIEFSILICAMLLVQLLLQGNVILQIMY